MEKRRLTEIFNRGFRCGANERASQGLPLSKTTQPPGHIPDSPVGHGDISGQIAWTLGYATGYQIGASDTEMASANSPGAHGMVSEMSEQMLENAGAFKMISDEP